MATMHPRKEDWPMQTVPKNIEQQSASFVAPILTGLLLGVLIGGILLGSVIALYVTQSNKVNTTSAPAIINATWNFNGDTKDQYNVYNGTAMNSASYTTGYTNLTSTALSLLGNSSQYVQISEPFLSLSYISFTVEIWLYPTALVSTQNYGLFGQCQTASKDLCLNQMIKNNMLYLSFYSDDQSGSKVLSTGKWYHVAFVYDYSTSMQSIYLDGVLVGNRQSNPYKGTSGPITIGASGNGTKFYFTGSVDQVALTTRAKTSSEILNDATLVCYFSFDSDLYSDSGPLNIKGSGVNVTSANGYVNNGISFGTSPSYFIVGGLLKLGTQSYSYSISIWIKPSSLSGGTIIHVSKCNYYCSGFWCLAFIGLTSTGQIAIQSWRSANGSNLVSLTGPVLSTNVWTHVVQTYSLNNGMCLYMNGLLVNQSATFSYLASGASVYIYLGLLPFPACVGSNTISMGQYYGLLDEFRLYSRELNSTEVYALANT